MRSITTTLALVLLSTPAIAIAQSSAPSFPDGAYEEFPSLVMAPVGPLASTPPPSGHWVEVTTRRARTTVRFMPDGRMRWVIRWGEHGPTRKDIVVDGATVATSRFTYDEAGHLLAKDVTRAGAASLHYDYVTDAAGLPIERRGTLPPAPGFGVVEEIVRITHDASGITAITTRADREVRRDVRDAEGRLVETRFTHGAERVSLHYVRDADGALLRVDRELGDLREAARTDVPEPALAEAHLRAVTDAPIERWEALLLFGTPARSTDEGRGRARVVADDWSGDACWLNATSELRFDGAGSLIGHHSACVCGFCVAAEDVVTTGEDVLGTDTHWWSGPWIVLDGVWVTPSHEVLTPSGPRAAEAIADGDLVMRADGLARPLASVERVERSAPRRTLNLRTADGAFVGGDLVFLSEEAVLCGP